MKIKLNNKISYQWHTLTHLDVAKILKTSLNGLSSREAEIRLRKKGKNILVRKGKENIFRILVRQFLNPLVYILLVATSLAIVLGKFADGIVIGSVILINAVIGFIQEYQTSNTIAGLLKLVPEKAIVLRDNEQVSLPISELVSGDYVFLQAGDRVPADLRISFTKNVQCDEAILTGESLPSHKDIHPVSPDAGVSERSCILFSGTLVTTGAAEGFVVETSMRTEMGKIASLLGSTKTPKSPLTLSLESLASKITYTIVSIGVLVFAIALYRNYSLSDAAFSAITLAVAAIPEGIPAVITIASTIGVTRMAKRKAIIRHLSSVETLGSTTVICSDKTGTLTINKMYVNFLWDGEKEYSILDIKSTNNTNLKNSEVSSEITNPGFRDLIYCATLCNDADLQIDEQTKNINEIGDPTEIALLKVSLESGIDTKQLQGKWKRFDELPFDSIKKIMATLHTSPQNEKIIYLKGAPESVLPLLKFSKNEQKEKILKEINNAVIKYAAKGMRVLAFASKKLEEDKSRHLKKEDLSEFVFMGLIAMSDPPRLEARDAIETCHTAGILVKMITGDHPSTAAEIGRQLGLTRDGKVITGDQLQKLNDLELREVVRDTHIFARVSPTDKLKIVKALQANGEIVAMTGDGVNDAPALKRADIGVAMGISGTAVAKESADMILANDNFESIEAAIEEGRRVYDNIIKSLAFLLPTSIGLGLVIFISVIFFPSDSGIVLTPMVPVQVLWINLITAVALTLPLALEARDPNTMNRPPRKPNTPLINYFLVFRIIFVALAMAGGTIGLFLWEYQVEVANGISADIAIAEAQTMAATTMVLFQVFYLLDCRSLTQHVHKIAILSNPSIYIGITFVIVAQMAFIYAPFMHRWFHTSILSFHAIGLSVLVAFSILIIIGIEKWILQNYFTKTVI